MKKNFDLFKNIVLIISLLLYSYLIFIGRNQYIFNMSYTKCIVFVILICIFIYTYGIVKNNNKTYNKNINIYIILFLILLISVTFFIGRTKIGFYSWGYSGQYVPFYTIKSQINYGSKLSVLKNLIGNSIMLIPLSFLLMIKNKKYENAFKQIIIILPTIIFIEILQAFTHTGSFDIDDIILNYLGTIIFTFIITRFSLIGKIRKLFYNDYRIKNKVKYVLFYLSTFLLVMFMIITIILK